MFTFAEEVSSRTSMLSRLHTALSTAGLAFFFYLTLISRRMKRVVCCLSLSMPTKKAGDFRVGVGSNSRDPSEPNNSIRYYDVHLIQLHEKWGETLLMGNDIALLTLAKPVSRRLKVGRIRLPEDVNDHPLPGHPVMAIGWGITTNFKPVLKPVIPINMQGGLFRVIPLSQCKQPVEKEKLPATKICVDSSKSAVCKVKQYE